MPIGILSVTKHPETLIPKPIFQCWTARQANRPLGLPESMRRWERVAGKGRGVVETFGQDAIIGEIA
jgi:hypothetical protein